MTEQELQKRNKRDIQSVLSTVQGRRLLWRVLHSAQIDQHGFVPGDPSATAFHCGQKSIGLYLMALLEECSPGICGQLRAEYRTQVEARQQEINRQQEEISNE